MRSWRSPRGTWGGEGRGGRGNGEKRGEAAERQRRGSGEVAERGNGDAVERQHFYVSVYTLVIQHIPPHNTLLHHLSSTPPHTIPHTTQPHKRHDTYIWCPTGGVRSTLLFSLLFSLLFCVQLLEKVVGHARVDDVLHLRQVLLPLAARAGCIIRTAYVPVVVPREEERGGGP